MSLRSRVSIAVALLTTLIAACATAPSVRVDRNREVDISAYRTFGFPEQLGTDRGGYSTLVTSYFKDAVRKQMTQRGYVYAETDPQLLVNFYTNLRERTVLRPSMSLGFGYYGYRSGLYQVWPMYFDGAEEVTYRMGTVNIDVVDAQKKQLVWEGIAEGQVHDADKKRPQQAIERVVALVMQQFPRRIAM
jgi:hypothetical protein